MDIKAHVHDRIRTNTSWYNKSYSGFFLGICEQGLAIGREGATNPYALAYGLVFQNVSEKNHFDWFWDVDEMKKKRKIILDKIKSDPSFIEEMLSVGDANHKKFVAYNEQIDSLTLPTLSNDELCKKFEKLHELLIEVSKWSYAVDAFLSDGEVDWLETIIKSELGSKATSEVIATLTFPTIPSFVNEAELVFLRLVKSLRDSNTELTQKLSQEYIRNYYWIRSNYKEYKRLTETEIIAEANSWISKNSNTQIDDVIRHHEMSVDEGRAHKAKLCEDLHVSVDLRSVLRISEVFTHLQDRRKERVLRMNVLFYEFVAETQKRFAIPDPLGFYMTADEVLGFYKSKPTDVSILQKRFDEGFLTLFYGDTAEIIPASEYKAEGIDKNFFADHSAHVEVKGTTAYKGRVTGIARVLRNASDIAVFAEGEILIANQTTPEYVPAMKKAAAIVTDQGGITCHAAIVARELKLPAVIGTKIATKVFKDGDMVEVDAERGIVRVLQK